jgi:ornithine--oxo-acid transaminase
MVHYEPNLIQPESVEDLKLDTIRELYRKHYFASFLGTARILGAHNYRPVRAEGLYYYDAAERAVLDCWCGYGMLNLGHNHPRLLAVRRMYEESRRPDVNVAFLSDAQAVLAHNLAEMSPGDLDHAVFYSTGAEAVEGALKIAEAAQRPKRDKIVYFSNSFHGKTRGALSVTGQAGTRRDFALLGNVIEAPWGDAGALAMLFNERAQANGGRSDIAAVIAEPIQGNGGIVLPPPGFFPRVRSLCDRHGALLIMDEIQSGFGRTGRFYAFEHEGIVPDMALLSKSLGGGKLAVAAVVVRGGLFRRVFGGNDGLALASSTFGGLGQAMIVASAAISVLIEEGLIHNAARVGEHLLRGLRALQRKHPRKIVDVRGRGLMIGIEFASLPESLLGGARRLHELFQGTLAIPVGVLLFADHDILAGYTIANRNVLRILPPLSFKEPEADKLLHALDTILSRSTLRIAIRAARKGALSKVRKEP